MAGIADSLTTTTMGTQQRTSLATPYTSPIVRMLAGATAAADMRRGKGETS